jgi:uncharacterized protein YjaG (DUF416 family)
MGHRRFDEQQLRMRLAALPRQRRVVFAAACAQRLLPSYERYQARRNADAPNEIAAILERIWRDVCGERIGAEELQRLIDRSMAIIPREDTEVWLPEQAAAEDAVAALAYALRCRQNGEAQEAVWAARRVYEALDHFVLNRDDIDTNSAAAEERVVADPLIQAEISRQDRDADELLSADIDEIVAARLRARAEVEGKSLFGERCS